MKRTIHPKALTLLISGLLVCLLVFWAQAQARKKPTPTPTPTPEKKITIEDTVERREGDNKIIFKSEFELVKLSGNTGEVRKKRAGTTSQPTRVIVGDITCDCTSDGSGGWKRFMPRIRRKRKSCTTQLMLPMAIFAGIRSRSAAA